MKHLAWLGLLFLVLAPGAHAQQTLCQNKIYTPNAIVERFVFSDGKSPPLRLVNLGLSDAKVARKLPKIGQQADKALQRLMRDAPWSVHYAEKTVNDDGECLAYVQTRSGKWVQEELLKQGLAYVVTPLVDTYTPTMLAIEQDAMDAKKGVWKRKDAAVRDAVAVADMSNTNSYQIVEGTIRHVRDAGRVKFVCLARDPWRSVCFLLLHQTHLALKEEGIDVFEIVLDTSNRMRFRGHLFYRDGLKMFVKDKEVVQLLSSAPEQKLANQTSAADRQTRTR